MDGGSVSPGNLGEIPSLPTGFQFSASNLQDYEICPRRFQLRYLLKLRWPDDGTKAAQQAEELARRGTDFHRLVHQHLLGMDEKILTETLTGADADLKTWWINYLHHRPVSPGQAQLYPEQSLSTNLAGYRLTAQFDLLAVYPDGRFLIVDWKTSGQRPPRRHLARQLQTQIYPYVLATAGAAFNGGRPVNPAAIKMMVWYAQEPDQPEVFPYSQKRLEQDEAVLRRLLQQVGSAAREDAFPVVEPPTPCRRCGYSSYCNRANC